MNNNIFQITVGVSLLGLGIYSANYMQQSEDNFENRLRTINARRTRINLTDKPILIQDISEAETHLKSMVVDPSKNKQMIGNWLGATLRIQLRAENDLAVVIMQDEE